MLPHSSIFRRICLVFMWSRLAIVHAGMDKCCISIYFSSVCICKTGGSFLFCNAYLEDVSGEKITLIKKHVALFIHWENELFISINFIHSLSSSNFKFSYLGIWSHSLQKVNNRFLVIISLIIRYVTRLGRVINKKVNSAEWWSFTYISYVLHVYVC